MGSRSIINLAGLLCLLFAPLGAAQLPALPQIKIPDAGEAKLPAVDQIQVPSLEEARGQIQLPNLEEARDQIQVPALDGVQLPVPTQIPALTQAQPPATAATQSQTPAQAQIQAPTPDQAQVPITPQIQAPAQTQAPVPVQAQIQAPAQTQAPVPVQAQIQVPTPDQTQVPIPTQVQVPAQAQTQTPAPLPAQTPAPAQVATPTLVAALAPNTDLCQMTTLDNRVYPRATVLDIQQRLSRIYSRDPEWPTNAQQDAVRLSDGILGSVTRSWMARFCRDFHLDRRGDVVTLLPLRVVGISAFADRFATTFENRLQERGIPETVSVLISADFAAWVGRLASLEQREAYDALSGGPDTDLLALVNRYLGPPPQQERPAEPDAIYVLREDDLAALQIGADPVPPEITAMLAQMKDLEFPERDLLHRAAQNNLINNLGLCKDDLAGAEDTAPVLLTREQYPAVAPWLSRVFPLLATLRAQDDGPLVQCNRFPYEDFALAYASSGMRDAIETAATEKMPEYTHAPIVWNGDDCGCVPTQVASIAYGIYPYWKAMGMEQQYDFSIFSRVGYFGLAMSNSGELRQIRAENATQTLLNDTGSAALDFIRVARTYGSKVDWMIDRDWNSGENSPMSVRIQLENLHNDIVQLLDRRPTDPLAALRPLLSLGVASQPFNGDGVTLYFRNFPNDSQSRLEFEYFFHTLKDDLRRLSDSHNRFHQVNQNLYLNVVVSQDEFTDPDSIFSSARLEQLLNIDTVVRENLSVIETQERVSSVILLLLDEPYYSSLDTIYTLTHETSRAVILPLMIADFRNMKDTPTVGGAVVDTRTKKLDYLHESFGGGAFWPIPELGLGEPDPYQGFEDYVTRKFAPGATSSSWTDTICPWRWPVIVAINAWLLLASALIAGAFFLYPHQCRRMPWLLSLVTRPVALVLILVPPTLAWFYLLIVDPLLTPFWYPYATTLLLIAIAILIGRALYLYLLQLRQRRPTRVSGYDPGRLALASGRKAQEPAADDDDDDDLVFGESFTAD